MAELFVDLIMEKLIDTCSKYLQNQFRWQTGEKELERLRENHHKIQAIVSAARQAQEIDPDSEFNKWIWQLRDAIDEADDVLDDIEYMKHEEQLAREKTNVSSTMTTMRKLKKIGELALRRDPSLKRLEEVAHKLDKISANASTFLHLLKDKKQEQQAQFQNHCETGPFPTDDLIGRGQDKEFVIQWLGKLTNEEHQRHVSNITIYNNIAVLSIVGPGGLGKTTLLQHVYEDEITKEFDLKMWVCVSNCFDVRKVIANMLESLRYSRPSLESLEALQNSLKSKVMHKRFLLVLDDIWQEDEEQDKSKWEMVLAPLAYGGLGSKILLTTRMNSVALMIAKIIKTKNEMLKLEGLEEDKCLQLLNTYAFANVNPNHHSNLRFITGELVKMLSGSPLSAKVLGGALNSNLDERHWRNVLNNVLDHDGIYSILKLGYIFLPKYLQNCFAFCSIFAQDHIFDKDDLVRMWIAVGFIQPSCIHGETLEDIGERYFDILIKKSFFHRFDEKYKLHGLLHELAKKVSLQECFRVLDDKDLERIPETIRHLSIETDNLVFLKKMRKFKNLRTLCITYDSDNQDLVDVLTKIFEESESIRLLSIFSKNQEMIAIPDKIGCLKHLRYLGLDFFDITLLPRSLSNLYHLQFLICECSASHDDLFPKDMKKLSNLRYLRSPHFKFPEIGKLKFLQELNGFEVKNESGYRIEELEHMNDIRILRIKGLENVRDSEEACNAKLCDKRKLMDLSLEWGDIHGSKDQLMCAKVLENLQPHKNLKKLTMKGYIGVRSAIWMNNVHLPFLMSLCLYDMPIVELPDLPPSLHDLSLHNLDNLNSLPSCLPSLSSLTSLSIWKAPQLRELLDLPPSLHDLSIHNLDNLNSLPSCLPSLSSLHITSVPQLQELPDLPPSLRDLSLQNLDKLNCLPSCLPSLSSLTSLSIWKAPQLRELPDLPPSLRDLYLHNLDNLNSLPSCLHSLSSLHITSVPQLQELQDLLPSLRELDLLNLPSLSKLNLCDLDNLNCLPSCLPSLSSLTSLSILKAPQLRELPDLPHSLHELNLKNLDNLNCLPSCLPRLSSLTKLKISDVPQLQELPDLPPPLCKLKLDGLDNLNCLPSCLPSLSSLHIISVPQLRELPDLPTSLRKLKLYYLPNLNSLPSCLPNLSSLTSLSIWKATQLRKLPDLPLCLRELKLRNLNNLNCLPSCPPSLIKLEIHNVPQLRELPSLPPSLCDLKLNIKIS